MQPIPDDLVARAAIDPQAFVELYNAYFKRVYNYIRYRSGDVSTAEDLTCSVFERLLVSIRKYSSQRGPFEAWMFAIARNVVNDHFQRQRFSWLPWEGLRRQPARDISPEEKVIRQENMDELQVALLKLDRRSLDLVSLKFFARLNNRQIAEITHLSESNVGVTLFRAVSRLREWLSEERVRPLQERAEKEPKHERA